MVLLKEKGIDNANGIDFIKVHIASKLLHAELCEPYFDCTMTEGEDEEKFMYRQRHWASSLQRIIGQIRGELFTIAVGREHLDVKEAYTGIGWQRNIGVISLLYRLGYTVEPIEPRHIPIALADKLDQNDRRLTKAKPLTGKITSRSA